MVLAERFVTFQEPIQRTKFLNGHGDATSGVIAGPARLIDNVLIDSEGG